MGVPNLRDFNLAMLAFWSKRLFDGRPSDWKKLLECKYVTDKPNILSANPRQRSPFWKSISWAFASAKKKYFYKWKIGDGQSVSFSHNI